MSGLSIIVITLNEAQRIAKLLSDLSQQTYRNFEVIVVDSNSDDKTCAIAQRFADTLPDLRIHVMSQRGVSLGRNTGAALAKYERLLFLDADVRLPPQFLRHSLYHLYRKKLDIAGVYMGAKQLAWQYKIGYGLFNVGLFVTQFSFPTAVGACIFSSRHIHQQINGFDQRIKLCEDCDYVKRAGQHTRFRLIPLCFQFDPRRLEQDGFFTTGWTYLRANIRRFFYGEMRNNEIDYQFGHYRSKM